MTASPAAQAHYQQRVDALCGAAIRAQCADAALHFRAQRLHRGARSLPLLGPHLQPVPRQDDFDSFRGATDAMALRLRHCDTALHRRLCPPDPIRRWVFEFLEQARVEAMAPAHMPGVVHNIRHRFERWSEAFAHSGALDTDRGLLLYTVAQIARARVTSQRVLEETEDALEATRAGIVPVIGHALAGLRRDRLDQEAYAAHALEIADLVAHTLRDDTTAGMAPPSRSRLGDEGALRGNFQLLIQFDSDFEEDGSAAVQTARSTSWDKTGQAYRVFTTAYDRELRPAAAIRRAQLDDYRRQLDQRIAAQCLNPARLTRALKAVLAQPATDGWDFGQEQGRLDARRLALLVSSPGERRVFRDDHIEPRADCAVAILIDCSGSMRQPIESIAALADLLARCLEQAGARCEVLGFTTGAWNGGRALRDWRRAGQPALPGRLNELHHLVYKDADTPWRRARRELAALLKPDPFRESVDGEALDWACERLIAQPDLQRRVLLVISDGSPTDSATALTNDPHYLDQHLREVIRRRAIQGQVQICGIGVGLDLSSFYDRCMALDLSVPLTNAAVFEIVGMLARLGS